jgi:SAM-dependent methyltransferase
MALFNALRIAPRCPVCALSNSRWVATHLDFRGVQIYHCGICDFLWSNPFPSTAELADYYQKKYDLPGDPEHSPLYAEKAEMARGQFEFIRRALPVTLEGLRVLEIECGSGLLLNEFHRRGAACLGLELDAAAAGYARDTFSLDVRNEDFRSPTLPSRAWDLILLSHVFEHFSDPVGALARLHDLLAPDGILFIEVPREDLPVFRLKRSGDYRHCASHLFFYGPESFQRLAEEQGFRFLSLTLCGPKLTDFYRPRPGATGVRRILNSRAGRPVKRWLRPIYRALKGAEAAAEPDRPAWNWNDYHDPEDPLGGKNIRSLLVPASARRSLSWRPRITERASRER